MDILQAKIVKRSVRIAGHMTSVSLEDPFWVLLRDIARSEGRSLNALITDIDSRRGTNLSSALRLYALDYLLRKN
jgi:predicted DNA-binding ribbon-helix-helix protein